MILSFCCNVTKINQKLLRAETFFLQQHSFHSKKKKSIGAIVKILFTSVKQTLFECLKKIQGKKRHCSTRSIEHALFQKKSD